MFDPVSRHVHTSFAFTEGLEGEDVTLARVHGLAVIVVRMRQAAKGWPARVGEIAPVAGVPSWCTRPGGWLAVLPREKAAAWRTTIGKRLAPATHQCLDLSGGFFTVDVEGPAAAAFLERGMALRLAELSEHRGARTLCAGVPAYVRTLASGGFRLHIDISLADPFWRWATGVLR